MTVPPAQVVGGDKALSTLYSTRNQNQLADSTSKLSISEEETILRIYYRATTPRMLRVAVNGLEGVQGVEQGLTGTAIGVGG